MAHSMRAQGATEYLVLLAVVLIVALVSIALLGFFPGLAGDAKMTQSAAYWKSEASPFSIQEHSVTGSTGATSLIVQNMDSSGTFTLTNVSLASSLGSCSNSTSTAFGSGETRTILCTDVSISGSAGATYELNVNITYTTPHGLTKTEFGSKPVIGKYN